MSTGRSSLCEGVRVTASDGIGPEAGNVSGIGIKSEVESGIGVGVGVGSGIEVKSGIEFEIPEVGETNGIGL